MENLNLEHIGNQALSPTFRDVLAIAFRHRRLMIVSFSAVLLGAVLAAILQPSRYAAEMKILVKRERVDPIVSSEAAALPQFALGVTEEELNSEVELLKSKDLLEKVVLARHLEHGPSSFWSKALAAVGGDNHEARTSGRDLQVPRAVNMLERKLSVAVMKKTNLIAVNYESSNPESSAQVLNTLADLYLQKHLDVHRPPGAFDFFHQQTERYHKGLADAEEKLVDFARGAEVISPHLEKEVALQKAAEFDAMQRQTQAAAADIHQRIRVLREEASFTPSRMVTQVRNLDDGGFLSQLRANLLNLQLKRTQLLEKFEPDYRPVRELETEIVQTQTALAEATKSQLHEETTDRDPTSLMISSELAKAKADAAGLQARAEATARAVNIYRENARMLQSKEMVQSDLLRTVKSNEENYLLYLRKEEEARISDALDRRRIINVAIAEPATVPPLPSNRRSPIVLVGLLFAAVSSLALACGAEYLDPTFRTADEVTAFLSIPVLASLPQFGKNGDTTHVS